LRLLAQGAHGSMRDALSLTDQAIAYAAGEVTLEAVQGMLGALDQSYLIRLLDALAKQDGADLLAVADEMATRSLSYNGALQDLGTLLHRIALAQTVPAAVPSDLPEYADIVRLAEAFDAEEVQLYYQIAVHGRNELGLAPDEYAGFSMTLLRMLAFRPGVGGAEGVPAAPAVARGPGAARAAAAAAGVAAPARAASVAMASHLSVPPPAAVVAGAAAMARSDAAAAARPASAMPAAHAPAPSPAAAPVPQSAAAPASSAPLSPARAAIQAALEAARAASGQKPVSSRPAPPPPPAAPPAAAPVAMPQSSAPPPQSARAAAPWEDAPPASAQAQPPAAPRNPAPWDDAPAAPSAAAARVPAADPWDDGRPAMGAAAVMEAPPAVATQPPARPAAPQAALQRQPAARPAADEDMPPWVTEFSDERAMPAASSAAEAHAPQGQAQQGQPQFAPRPAAAPAKAPHSYVITPVPELDWDGNWPALSARLPLRGVAQQLATQAELIECVPDGTLNAQFRIRVPIETWRTPPNVEKLAVALTERFGRPVRVETELGAVWYTASAEAQAHREACQKAAEETVANDPFIQSMIRDFGAHVVPGSIVPPPAPPAH
jgi:DNA polymerase-3 subunit gamma/tau